MGRTKKDRPRQYKTYILTYEERQLMVPEIPESTLRYKRKREDSSGSSTEQETNVDSDNSGDVSGSGSNDEAHGSETESDLESFSQRDPDQDPSWSSPLNNSRPTSNESGSGSNDEAHGSETESDLESFSQRDPDQDRSWSSTLNNSQPISNESSSESEEAPIVQQLQDPMTDEPLTNESGSGSNDEAHGSETESDLESFSQRDPDEDRSWSSLLNNSQPISNETVTSRDDFTDFTGPIFDEVEEVEENVEEDEVDEGVEEDVEDGGEDNVEEENGHGPIDPFSKLKKAMEGSFRDPLNVTVTLSVGEILINALMLVKKHKWNHTEKTDLMQFTNALLNNKDCVPSSRFLLDKLLYSKVAMTYIFFCCHCTSVILEVCAANHTHNQVSCPSQECLKVNDISDLSKATYFVVFDIPSQLKILLETPGVRKKIVNPLEFVNDPPDKILRDLYHGSSYIFFANHVQHLVPLGSRIISFSLSVDSASPCSFSGQSICPCFIMVNELPTVVRMKNLLIGGLWFGLKKEKMDLLLPPIVKHISELSTTGFSLDFEDETWRVHAYLIACVADSVARCDIHGIHSHRGDFPCSWCLCEGVENGSTRIFPYERTLPPLRTIEELLEDSRQALTQKTWVRGIKYMTPLAAAPLFHPVNGFVVDQMHAKDEGCTKSFLQSWLGEDGKTPYYIGKKNIPNVNKLLDMVKIPKELRKRVRSLGQLNYWTGRELENWCFFLSLSVLPGILPNRYLTHWALYVQGTYLLVLSAIHPDVIDIAEELLEEFCCKTEGLYGLHMMRFNMHLVRHFAENCRRWGPLFALSAYQFERGNQTLKNLVHGCNGIPNQVCRGLSEDQALTVLKGSCGTRNTSLFEEAIDSKSHAMKVKYVGKLELLGFAQNFEATQEEKFLFNELNVGSLETCVQYNLIRKDGCTYGPGSSVRNSKIDNSYAQLSDKKIIRIFKIVHCETTNNCWVLGRRVRVVPSTLCPIQVIRYDPSLCCKQVVTSIDEDMTLYDVSMLSTVCVNMNFPNEHSVSPMPNIFNMF